MDEVAAAPPLGPPAPAPVPRTVAGPAHGQTSLTGMWMFLATDAMGFGAMLTAYGVLRVRADAWPDPHQRLAVAQTAVMTFVLVTSSLTMTLAVLAARAEKRRSSRLWLAATVALGLLFLGGQALEYGRLLAGPQAMGLTSDAFASTFYALTGFHGAHVLAGVVLLGILLLRGRAGAGTLEVAALFWHFVDLAWVPIFSFVYLLPTT